jgi:hypothetical protein
MALPFAPFKTAAGQEELSRRVRGLGQRHRTVLLLVDGRRTHEEVLRMAAQAGAPDVCFDELVSMGLIELPPPPEAVDHVELPLDEAEAETLEPDDEESHLARSATLAPESTWVMSESAASVDGPLEEARAILLRALRNEAPVTGVLTARKLKRAASRSEVEELLDEVEQRIRKPRKMIVTAQTLRHVRHLLSLPVPQVG